MESDRPMRESGLLFIAITGHWSLATDMGISHTKLWGGRFRKQTDPLVEGYTSSIRVDYRLARYDVIGSIAHAKMLGRCQIIGPKDCRKLVRGLERILRTIEQGDWQMDPSAEDVHTQIQQQLERRVGSVAHKLHTARSRNDQVSLDLRLYCRDAVIQLAQVIGILQRALIRFAAKSQKIVIPGYTHLQRAQPVLFAHHLLAYVEMLQRDAQRLEDVQRRIQVLPLGAAALAGTSLPIDRHYVAKLLGFPRIAANSLDAVSDRDFACELIGVLAGLHVHLSRFAQDCILWATEEFGLIRLDDAIATGSSLMPQKKNPDVLELIRGQAGLIIGNLSGFLTVMKGLPLSYNRDLQWDKRFVFESVEASVDALTVLERFVCHLNVRPEGIAHLLESDFICATDLAEYLVERGLAFRQAHEVVGRLVAFTETQGKRLKDLSLAQLRRFSKRFDEPALRLADPYRSVERKRSFGSTHPAQVRRALRQWRLRLGMR